MSVNWLDWTLLAVIGLSTLRSLWCGFARSFLSLLAWLAAVFAAFAYGSRLAVELSAFIGNEFARQALAHVLLFVVIVMLGSLLGNLVANMFKAGGLTGADRALGTIFGLARGLLLAAILMAALRFIVPVDSQETMNQSRLAPHLEMMQRWVLRRMERQSQAFANRHELLSFRSIPRRLTPSSGESSIHGAHWPFVLDSRVRGNDGIRSGSEAFPCAA